MQLCMQRCPILPAQFEANLTALFSHLFSDPDEACADIRAIICALEQLLSAQ